MKKYVNGEIMDMTNEDLNRRNARAKNRPNHHNTNTSDYEARIKELESMVATLVSKLEEPAEPVEDTPVEDAHVEGETIREETVAE